MNSETCGREIHVAYVAPQARSENLPLALHKDENNQNIIPKKFTPAPLILLHPFIATDSLLIISFKLYTV